MHPKFSGISVALMTPYKEDLSLDWSVFERYVDWICQKGVQGILVCGSTGEFLALSEEERAQLIKVAVQITKGRASVIAGTAGFTIAQTVEYTNAAEKAGADAALIVTPFYIKTTMAGLKTYFQSVHESTNLPIILYSNAGRTMLEIDVDLIRFLSTLERIVGLKDSSHDLSRPLMLGDLQNFALLAGEDGTCLSHWAGGGNGLISVAAGLLPAQYIDLFQTWQAGNPLEALKKARKLANFAKFLFSMPNPVLVKYGCEMLGFGKESHRRLSFEDISDSTKATMGRYLTEFGAL